MLIPAEDLTDTTLAYAVAKAEGFTLYKDALLDGRVKEGWWLQGYYIHDANEWLPLSLYNPHNDWSQGGPIIEQHGMWVVRMSKDLWLGRLDPEAYYEEGICGPTLLIAAMRRLVASKLGAVVDVPDDIYT